MLEHFRLSKTDAITFFVIVVLALFGRDFSRYDSDLFFVLPNALLALLVLLVYGSIAISGEKSGFRAYLPGRKVFFAHIIIDVVFLASVGRINAVTIGGVSAIWLFRIAYLLVDIFLWGMSRTTEQWAQEHGEDAVDAVAVTAPVGKGTSPDNEDIDELIDDLPEGMAIQVHNMAINNRKIEAVKLVRDTTGLSLVLSKAVVDRLETL